MDPTANQNIVSINPEVQKKLNEPVVDPNGISAEDQVFLNQIVAKVESGEIRLFEPGSLINKAVYDQLPEDKQGKVDFEAVNMITTVRNIYELWQATQAPTFQISNMVHQARLTKERLEGISGDVFVI